MSTRVSFCAFRMAFLMLIASKTESMLRKQLLSIARAISHLKNHHTILILNPCNVFFLLKIYFN